MRRNQVLSDAKQSIPAKLAPTFTELFEIIARLRTKVYELLEKVGNDVAKRHVVELKRYYAEIYQSDGEVEEITPEN